MFDFVRELEGCSNMVFVGREVGGQRHSFYCIHLDSTQNGKDWCRSHGMKLIDRVPNITKTAWYEIWASDDMRLMMAFII